MSHHCILGLQEILKGRLGDLGGFSLWSTWCLYSKQVDNYIFIISEEQISNNILPQCIKWLWRKSDHKLMVIVLLIIPVDFESIKKNFFQIIQSCCCSSRVVGCIAALLPRPLGLQPVNFIFNVLFLGIMKIYLFKHGRKINELTFITELLCYVLASLSQGFMILYSSNPGG